MLKIKDNEKPLKESTGMSHLKGNLCEISSWLLAEITEARGQCGNIHKVQNAKLVSQNSSTEENYCSEMKVKGRLGDSVCRGCHSRSQG